MKSIQNYLRSELHESFSINEIGIKLIPAHFSKIRESLQALELRAPSMSSTKLDFENMGDEIKGILVINGHGKRFMSTVTGDNPLDIYDLLEENINKQLLAWKKTRFLNKYISTPMNGVRERLTGGYAV